MPINPVSAFPHLNDSTAIVRPYQANDVCIRRITVWPSLPKSDRALVENLANCELLVDLNH